MKKIILAMTVIVILIILQLFVRYEKAQVGPIELKYDKITSAVYVRSTKDRTWKKSRFDNFNKAKSYYSRTGWDHVNY
jgi:uncharacterized protein YxeA